ncbi:hypothetical protein PL81_11400 [Streptomyces sp. RSD-27]|nr:hypothetical protein PL81_11400 [Streptomyces sp. RSD-27]
MPPTTTPLAPGRAGAPADPAVSAAFPVRGRGTAGRAAERDASASVRAGSAAPSGRAGRRTTREAS